MAHLISQLCAYILLKETYRKITFSPPPRGQEAAAIKAKQGHWAQEEALSPLLIQQLVKELRSAKPSIVVDGIHINTETKRAS